VADDAATALRDQRDGRRARPAQRVHQPRLGVAPEGEAVQARDRGVVRSVSSRIGIPPCYA
jgi:hypothetical protein